MAQKVQVLFEDDLDGSEAEGTINFGLDGSDYEIDLNTAHADDLRNVFAPYVAVARRITVGRSTGKTRTRQLRVVTSGPSNTEVREWAKAQGIDVKDRGRIPAELIERYKNRDQVKATEPEPDKQEGNGQTPPEVTFKPPKDGAEDQPKTTTTRAKRAPRKTKES